MDYIGFHNHATGVMAGCKDSCQEGQRLDVMGYVRVGEHSGGKDTQIFCGKTCMKGGNNAKQKYPPGGSNL